MLIKKTPKHLIIINFDYRRRIVKDREDLRSKFLEEDPKTLKSFEPESFSTWLRKNNLLPPDFDLPEYDEENIKKEYDQSNVNPLDKIKDHEDDTTLMEICIINKQNEGLIINASVF